MLVLSVLPEDLDRVNDVMGLFDLLEVVVKEPPSFFCKQAIEALPIPVMLTLKREELLEVPWRVSPQIIDLPWDSIPSSVAKARALFPAALLQGSYHGISDPSVDFKSLFQTILDSGFTAVKIACAASSATEAVRLLRFLKEYRHRAPLTCVPIGSSVQFGRLVAMAMGSYESFCCLPGCPTAEGQIDIVEAHALYAAAKISGTTQIFGLVGESVDSSPSHRTHTKLLRAFGVDGLYVKIPFPREAVAEVMPMVASLGFSGLSITTPLKERCFPSSSPVNTWKKSGDGGEAINTDGPALVDALSARLSLSETTILLIGAGAVGKASALALAKAGATLCIYNRTDAKSKELASLVGGRALTREELFASPSFAAVVNATSAHHSGCFPKEQAALPLKEWGVQVAAEFAFPEPTPFIQAAQRQGISTIQGTELWMRQAAKQVHWWCAIDEQQALIFLRKELGCQLL